MSVFGTYAAKKPDLTRTLRDVAQHRLRHTTTVGEALYHQATAKAAALAIPAEFPTAAYLELDPSEQEGSNFSPGAILDASGNPIADDSYGTPMDAAERWDAVMGAHYGPLTDLPEGFTYDYETREAVPPYPWLIATRSDDVERIDRMDVRAAAELDLTDAIAAAFPDPVPPSEELGALGIDGVVVKAALVDTGARHHPPLPEWPANLASPAVTGGRAIDGETHLTVTADGDKLLTVAGVWTGERYTDDVDWRSDDGLSDTQQEQVEAWARQVWIRLAHALDNVVDHAVAATIEPVIARITTDHPTPSAEVLADLSTRAVAEPDASPAGAEDRPQPAGPPPGLPRFTHPAFDGVAFDAVAYREPWNGWATPVVDRATLEALLGHLDPQWLRGWVDGDVLHLEHLENGFPSDGVTLAPGADGTYDLGTLGWKFELTDASSPAMASQAPSSYVMPDVGPEVATAPGPELGW